MIGGIGVGIGAVSGFVALSDKSDLDKNCDNKICGVDQHSNLDAAKRWGNVSTTFFIIGGVAMLVGLYATLSPPRSSSARVAPVKPAARVKPDFGPGGAGIHGTF